jgi:hypothetical protein
MFLIKKCKCYLEGYIVGIIGRRGLGELLSLPLTNA